MSKTKMLSEVFENALISVVEAVGSIRKDGVFDVKTLSVEMSLDMEQRIEVDKEISNNVFINTKHCSQIMLRKHDKFSSRVKVTFVPKIAASDRIPFQ